MRDLGSAWRAPRPVRNVRRRLIYFKIKIFLDTVTVTCMNALNGRHALVTGGGRGIGRAIAAALTASGATVTVTGRHADALGDAVAKADAAGYFVADVTDAGALADGAAAAAAQRGPIDILVANAGGAETAPFARTDGDMFRRMIDLNLMGVVHATQAVIGDMTARSFGRIVAVASTAGLRGYAYVSAYCAAKHAVIGLVRALAIETAKNGITVNAVCPGFADTDLTRQSIDRVRAKTGRSEQAVVSEFIKQNPLGRLIAPDEVAAAVTFLCSTAASAVTGTTLTVAGGEM
jgi:NAD(P)-dependent dehydrogenase (short-subunit alcohol dehydrogenase family)